MMRSYSLMLVVALAVVVLATAALAQDQTPPKVEIFVGYSFLHVGDINAPDNNISKGWGANLTYNFTPHVGIGGDFGGHYSDVSDVSTIMFGPKITLYN